MGELAVIPEDLSRYVKDGYSVVAPAMTVKLDALVREVEAQKISFKGWATPGATVTSAALWMWRERFAAGRNGTRVRSRKPANCQTPRSSFISIAFPTCCG
jgi:hypothetical protein